MRRIALWLSLAVIFMIPWEGVLTLVGFGSDGSTAVKFLGLGVTAFWVITVVITGQFRKPELFHISVFLFVLWNAFSVFWSGNVNRTINHLVTWVLILGFTFIIWDLFTSRNAIFAGLQAYVLGAYVAIGIAIANFMAGRVFYTHYQRFSPASETNPDGFGFILALGIPVAWYLASFTSSTKMVSLFKLINYAYIPAAFIGITLSGTRTALLVAIPGMIFGISTLSRARRSARVSIILLLAVSILMLLPYVEILPSFQRFGTTIDELTAGDLTGRVSIWREGFASFAAHPLVGVGSNMYRSINSVGKVAHNSFLSVLVEVGLIGFALFVLILTIAIIQAWIQPKWEKRFWLTMLAVWAIGASVLTYEHRKATWLFLSLLVASATLLSHRDEADTVDQPGEAGAPNLLNSKRVTFLPEK